MSGQPPLPPPPPDPSRAARPWDDLRARTFAALRSGWGVGALSAVGILLLLFALNVLLSLLQQAAVESFAGELLPAGEELPQLPAVRSALFGLFMWHGVSLDVEFPFPQSSGIPFPVSLHASVSIPFLAGAALAGWLLYRAGRLVAARSGNAGLFAALDGPKVALPYAALTAVLAVFSRADIGLPGGPDDPQAASASVPLGAGLAFPLLIALGAATAGAVSRAGGPRDVLGRLVLGAIAGGWRMVWLSVTLASVGFLILAALHPDVTRAYLDLLPGGAPATVLLVVLTLLLLPNAGAGIAAASMGGSINVAALGDSCAVVSYVSFPHGPGAGPAGGFGGDACSSLLLQGIAPLPYFLFLLVPAIATLAGGWLAAQRAGAGDATRGAQAGVLAALPFGALAILLAAFVRIGYEIEAGFPLAVGATLGPGIISTFLLALVWGALGGAIGGAIAGARNVDGPGTEAPGPSNAVSSV